MKLFVDSADLADIETIASWGVLSGVTTNPTLLGKVEGEADEIYRRVCELVNGPVSAEVVTESRGDMVEEGRRLAAIHPNIVVKLPMGAEGLAATSALAEDDISVNMTLCFTAPAGPAGLGGRGGVRVAVRRPLRRHRPGRARGPPRGRRGPRSPRCTTPRCWRRRSAAPCT